MAHLPSSPDVDDRITTWCDVASEMRPMAIAHKSKAQDMPAGGTWNAVWRKQRAFTRGDEVSMVC